MPEEVLTIITFEETIELKRAESQTASCDGCDFNVGFRQCKYLEIFENASCEALEIWVKK